MNFFLKSCSLHESTKLKNIQKLFYLKDALIGQVSEIIRDFPLNDQVYSEAWSFVVSRYDNKEAVLRASVHKIVNLDLIKNNTKIRNLIDEVEMNSMRLNG